MAVAQELSALCSPVSDTVSPCGGGRNEVKLTLYRHFTNTLILAVLASWRQCVADGLQKSRLRGLSTTSTIVI